MSKIISFTIAQKSATTPAILFTDPRICAPSEKGPGICYFLYKPVCGVYINSAGNIVKQTYANRCFACRSSLVQYVYDRPCSSFPANSNICIPHPFINYFCIQSYIPVCGYFNKSVNCVVAPCANTYRNGCYACMDRSVDYYIQGACKIIIKYPPPIDIIHRIP